MARYLMVAVDENEVADKLIPKLDSLKGVKVVGMFGKPTKFCDGTCQAGEQEPRSLTGAKYGWRVCPKCRRPKKLWHSPKNLLEMADLPVRFRDLIFRVDITVQEPFDGDPVEKYGMPAIEAQRIKSAEAKEKIDRLNSRRNRSERRKSARARRRETKEGD